jgi:hypothetical protein
MKYINIEYILNKIKVYKSIFYNFIINEWKILLAVSITVKLLLITIMLNIQFFKNLFKDIINNIKNNITLENYYNFLLINRYILIFLFIIWIGICFDHRFSLNRKILLPIYLIIFLNLIIIFKNDYYILNEIFWYTSVLNLYFIFNVLIFYWIYNLASIWKLEFLAFVIKTITFIFSINLIIYVLHSLYLRLGYYENYYSFHIIKIFKILLYSLLLILIYLINIILQYSLFLMGKNKIKYNLNILFKNIFFIIWTLIVAFIIFGIARLYFIWIYYIIRYILKILWQYNIYIYSYMPNILKDEFSWKIIDIYDDYNILYNKNFVYGFIEFLDYTNTYNNPHKFHIRSPFIYYNKNDNVITYITSYFDYIISSEEYIDKLNYDLAFLKAKSLFNLSEDELNNYKKNFDNIYKEKISFWNDV